MVELYSDVNCGLWRVVMQEDGKSGRVEYSRIEMPIQWHLDPCGKIMVETPEGLEGYVPMYVMAKIAAMCKISYQWHSLKRSGIDYGECTVVKDDDIDSLVETHGYEYTAAEIAELKARKEELTEIAIETIMEVHWMEAVGEATVSLLNEEITE